MRTSTYTPNIIKMGISDYLSMSIDKGKLYFHNLKVHEDLPDWIESSDVDVGVELGYVHNYVVPSGQGIIFEMNNLDPTGNFMVEILNTGSPTNYPDFLIENYSGEYQFQNKSLRDILVTLKITPINGSATSSSKYNIKVKALNSWPNFIKSCNFFTEANTTGEVKYPVSGKLGPFAVWDILRHNNVRLDITAYRGGQAIFQEKITYNSEDKMFHVFPKHFNTTRIDEVDISVRITLQNFEGIFSIITDGPILSDRDLDTLYNKYYELYSSQLADIGIDGDSFLDQQEYTKLYQNSTASEIYLDKSSFNNKLGNGQPFDVANSTSIESANIRTDTYSSIVGSVTLPSEGY